jgi:hypothetical protein
MSPEVSPTAIPVGIVAEIESTKRRIQAEIDVVTERTNIRIDAISMDAIENINKDNYISTTEDIATTQCSLDIYVADEIQRTWTAMDAEIVRLMHMSYLMKTLYHEIESATLNLHKESYITQSIAKESPTIALESPTIAITSPTIANGSPTVANESPTIANESPTVANASRTIAIENQTVAKETSSITKQCVPEIIIMITDHSQLEDDERILIEMEAERTAALRFEPQQLGLDEQRTHDKELSQLHEDIIHYDND